MSSVRLSVSNSRSTSVAYEISQREGGVIYMDTYKGGNGGKIQAMVTSHYFIVCQVSFLGVSYHCVKITKLMTCTHGYIYIKSTMDWIQYPALDT